MLPIRVHNAAEDAIFSGRTVPFFFPKKPVKSPARSFHLWPSLPECLIRSVCVEALVTRGKFTIVQITTYARENRHCLPTDPTIDDIAHPLHYVCKDTGLRGMRANNTEERNAERSSVPRSLLSCPSVNSVLSLRFLGRARSHSEL